MKVRFVIDRVVLDGFDLPISQRVLFEEQLRASIADSLRARAALARQRPDTLPASRQSWRTASAVGGVEGDLGAALGATLTQQVWKDAGPITPQRGG